MENLPAYATGIAIIFLPCWLIAWLFGFSVLWLSPLWLIGGVLFARKALKDHDDMRIMYGPRA